MLNRIISQQEMLSISSATGASGIIMVCVRKHQEWKISSMLTISFVGDQVPPRWIDAGPAP